MKSLIVTTIVLGLSTSALANPEPSVMNEINYHSSGSIGQVASLTETNSEPSIMSQFGNDYHQLQLASSGRAPQIGDSRTLNEIKWFTNAD